VPTSSEQWIKCWPSLTHLTAFMVSGFRPFHWISILCFLCTLFKKLTTLCVLLFLSSFSRCDPPERSFVFLSLESSSSLCRIICFPGVIHQLLFSCFLNLGLLDLSLSFGILFGLSYLDLLLFLICYFLETGLTRC